MNATLTHNLSLDNLNALTIGELKAALKGHDYLLKGVGKSFLVEAAWEIVQDLKLAQYKSCEN